MIIRPANAGDRPALLAQFQALNVFEDAIAHDRRIDDAGAALSLDTSWQAVRRDGGHALVAETQGVVVGHLFLLFRDDEVFVRPERSRHGYVCDLFVREAARGQGAGRALLAEAERLTRQAGLARLTIGVLAGNAAAAGLYAALGFTPYAVELTKPLD